MTTTRGVGGRYRAGVAARTAAAVFGGYGVAALVAIAGAWALPLPRIEAAAAGTIAALLVIPAVAMGCFWARSAARAWGGVVLAVLVVGAVAMAGGWRP